MLRRKTDIDPTLASERRRIPLLIGFAAAVGLVIVIPLTIGAFRSLHRSVASSPPKTTTEHQLTHNPVENPLIAAALSPDGNYIAYIDTKGLHLSGVSNGEMHDVPIPADLQTDLWDVTWFPDGKAFILSTGNRAETERIWVTSVYGGSAHVLREDCESPAVSPDGSRIAFIGGRRHELWVMGADGKNPHKILFSADAEYDKPVWSPAGQRLAFIKSGGSSPVPTIETVSLQGDPATVVGSDPYVTPTLLWAHDGRIIFARSEGVYANSGSNLWAIRTDPRTGLPFAPPMKITDLTDLNPASLTVSADAGRIAVVKAHVREDIYFGVLKAGSTRLESLKKVTASESMDYPSGWTEDTSAILFWSNRTGRNQIFRQQLSLDTPESISPTSDDQVQPEVSPDGRWILYWGNRHGATAPIRIQLMRVSLPGGAPEEILATDASATIDFHCFVGAAYSCIMSRWENDQMLFYALDPVLGLGKKVAAINMALPDDIEWRVSGDGSFIAIESRDRLQGKIRIVDCRSGEFRDLPLPSGWNLWGLSWESDGKAIFVAAQTKGYFIARLGLDGSTHVLVDGGRPRWLGYICPSRNGRYLAFSERTVESNAWLMENF